MELSLTQELDKIRALKKPVDVSRGMALVFREDKPIGLFTVAFAESWCKDDPEYHWERV